MQSQLTCTLCGAAGQVHRGFAALAGNDFNFAPANTILMLDPNPQNLAHRLLGGETRRQFRWPPATVGEFAFRKDSRQKAIAEPGDRRLDAFHVYKINTGG